MNETARKEAEKVLNRMKQEGKDSHEYGMLYDFLDFLTGLCWKKEEVQELDLEEAEAVLDREHYGLKKSKAEDHTADGRDGAEPAAVRFDPFICWTAGNRKDEHRAEHCGSAAQKVCQSQFGRRPG